MMDIITCYKGWESIYLPIVKSILEHDNACDSITKKIGVKAVKNENGMLRIITYNPINSTKEIRFDIINASTQSLKQCEFCGDTENVGYSYDKVMRTCCENCFNKNIQTEFPKATWRKLNKK